MRFRVEKTKNSRHEHEAQRTPPGDLLSAGIQTEGSVYVYIVYIVYV